MKAALSMLAAGWLLAASPSAAQSADAALAQRVQELEDEKAIREVLVQYGEFLDARDYAAYSRLFARGVWTGGFGSFTGPAAIEAMLVQNLGAPEPGFLNKTSFHLITTPVVEVEGDTATARSRYLFFTASDDERPNPLLAGRYEDAFVRENEAWKIRRRITHGVIPWRDGNDSTPTAPPPRVPTSR
jgi:hypothetical protein